LKVYKIIYIFTVLYSIFSINDALLSQSRIELSFNIGYSVPLLETYGTDVKLASDSQSIFVAGKRWLVSSNLGAEKGFTVQTFFKYSFFKSGLIKGLFNLGYNILSSSHSAPGDDYGVRVQSFSIGIGPEINPIGVKKFYPSVFVLLRVNFVGGETYYHAGLDFIKVVPRYGYSGGLNLNYKLNDMLGLFAGFTYSYDNTWNKQTEENAIVDVHVISFRDKQSPTNGLISDRRIAYSSYFMGMNFYLK
jgi:hypothetical protein